MSVSIIGLPTRGNRGTGFDRRVRRLASTLQTYQNAGIFKLRDLVDALNADHLKAPNGKTWSYTTLRRVIVRAIQLGYRLDLQIPSQAASTRIVSYAPRSKYGMTDA